MRAIVALLSATVALALVTPALAAAPLTVVFKPATPAPKVGVKWPYRVIATAGGKPVAARLTVTLVDPIGQTHPVEFDRNTKPIKNAPFTGTFRDKILFPAESRGFTLTLRFAVTAGGARKVVVAQVTPR